MTSDPNGRVERFQAIASGETLAAKRYALAAFELAREHGDIEAWRDSLGQIADFMSDPEVKRVLENTRATMEPKQRLVEAALGDLPPLPLNLARLLLRKQRTGLSPDIAMAFNQLIDEQRGVNHAHVRTAVPLTEPETAALARRLQEQTGHEVVLTVEVDPSVLGGLIIQIGDKLIDASTRGRLQAMRESLVGAV